MHTTSYDTQVIQDHTRLYALLLSLAGAWELYSCKLVGCFSMSDAVALLPSCLQHIALSLVGVHSSMARVLNKHDEIS